MRELPCLMNGHGVRATLAGTKTMTRRPVKPQPPSDAELPVYFDKRGWTWLCEDGVWPSLPARVRSPLGVPGDLLYVREAHTWITLAENEYDSENPCHKRHPRDYPVMMIYRADGIEIPSNWRPSIHMPKWAARLWLRNMGVRVERVQSITEEDAIAEGIERLFSPDECQNVVGVKGTKSEHSWRNYLWHGFFGMAGGGNKMSDQWPYQYSGYESARDSFSSLWQRIYAKHGLGWDSNCWVFVTSYEVTER